LYLETTMPAPLGNQNSTKEHREWANAIRRAVARREKDGKLGSLNDLADVLIDKALEGDSSAIKEFGDRHDGKPAQAITGPEGGPVGIQVIERVIVRE
jgi:hypothetical protein